ncbi:MAG: acetyl-CoA carboxylase biotin carboxylase subunit [Candidatus Korobacteraceae bacterium]
MFRKILIANRGEIAVRVIRACRELGIVPVAVYSEADRAALHVRLAEEAIEIGPSPAVDSYLNIEKVLQAARRCGAEAIHPGYGFLSENPRFAHACELAGIKFIGPSSAAMEIMGSKTRARQAMQAAGVPLVPGSSAGLNLPQARQLAGEIGYPVMLKAAAGGGGKGMRLVASAAELPPAFEAASSEAERAFGDGEVYLEKFLLRPRHIEMQVLADEHGNTVWLGERECSVQRRHQKVLEESPSPLVTAELRQRMGEVAVRAAQAARYSNAGTIEFLVDAERNFYFLEMNTRLQVEHPVTEMVTGLDLVRLQIAIAAGERLPFAQQDVTSRGNAIECRIYAEDPGNNFFPSPGTITQLNEPAGPGIRVDSGVYEGWTVPIDYDPLLAKLIAWGADREQAIQRLQRALGEAFVGGITTNLSLFRAILSDADFLDGNVDTSFLDRLLPQANASPSTAGSVAEGEDETIAALAAALFSALESARATGNGNRSESGKAGVGSSSWKRAGLQEAMRGRE